MTLGRGERLGAYRGGAVAVRRRLARRMVGVVAAGGIGACSMTAGGSGRGTAAAGGCGSVCRESRGGREGGRIAGAAGRALLRSASDVVGRGPATWG